LDVIAPYYGCIPVVVILGISRKVDLPQELLLMILEFSHHRVLLYLVVNVYKLDCWRR
jgi:hypothetical protein